LTRSIAIVAGGDAPGQSFEAAAAHNPGYAFGGHTIVRQGFRAWLGAGGHVLQARPGQQTGHYPINFYLSGLMPADTFVKDSILRDTMSSWYQPHAIMGCLDRTKSRVTGRASRESRLQWWFFASCHW
jgi:hypothetical protein